MKNNREDGRLEGEKVGELCEIARAFNALLLGICTTCRGSDGKGCTLNTTIQNNWRGQRAINASNRT